MKTSEPVTKEYVDEFLERNEVMLLSGRYNGFNRIFQLRLAPYGVYTYLAGTTPVTTPIAKQLLIPMDKTRTVSWGTLTTTYSEIRHVFPTAYDLVE